MIIKTLLLYFLFFSSDINAAPETPNQQLQEICDDSSSDCSSANIDTSYILDEEQEAELTKRDISERSDKQEAIRKLEAEIAKKEAEIRNITAQIRKIKSSMVGQGAESKNNSLDLLDRREKMRKTRRENKKERAKRLQIKTDNNKSSFQEKFGRTKIDNSTEIEDPDSNN